MPKKVVTKELNNEENVILADQNQKLLETIEALKQNQEGFIAQNDQLREAINNLQNGKAIYGKLLAVKKDLGYVGKDQRNAGQGWMFRGIDQFLNTVKPLFDKHGIGVLPEFKGGTPPEFIKNEKTGKTSKVTSIVMNYTFFAEDGSKVTVSVPAEGVDPGDKGTNKALSAAMKYALIQTFSVPTKDMAEGDKENITVDGEGSSTPAKTPAAKSPEKESFRRTPTLAAVASSAGEL